MKFGEPNERRATPYGQILGATPRAAAHFSAIRRCSTLVERATRRALRLVLRKIALRRDDLVSVNRP